MALLGQDVETSAVVRYQLQFRLDVNNLALVLYLQFLKQYWASVVGRRFQISQQRQALTLVAIFFDTPDYLENFSTFALADTAKVL